MLCSCFLVQGSGLFHVFFFVILFKIGDWFQIQDYSLVCFLPLDITDEDSVTIALSAIDNAIQYGEDLEPKAPKVMKHCVKVEP